ncbi:MAG: hypothetical protein NT141_01790 [candidate division WWE3 bacterium]|nr:hypothetical protein [candidate division WWE3 bacterium]
MPDNITTPTTPPTIVTIPQKCSKVKPFLAGFCLGGCLMLIVPALFLGYKIATSTANKTATTGIPSSSGITSLLRDAVLKQTIGAPATVPTLPKTAKDCGQDLLCIQQATSACSPAKAEVTAGPVTMTYQIVGPSLVTKGNCQVAFTITKVDSTNSALSLLGLQGQNMLCDLSPAIIADPSTIVNAPESAINCSGSLWGLLKIVRSQQTPTNK